MQAAVYFTMSIIINDIFLAVFHWLDVHKQAKITQA